MKKIFTSVALLLASCSFANAQSHLLNYQGICTKTNSDIEVTFVIENKDGKLYEETQTVTTSAQGVFTAKIGKENTADFDAIDWAAEGLSLVTSIDGQQVSTTKLTAVPYAKVAERYVGQENIENDLQDLVEGMRNKANVDDVANLRQSVDNMMENVDMQLQPVFREVYGGEVYNEATDETTEVKGLVDRVSDLEALTDDLNEGVATLPVQVTAIQTILNGSEGNAEEGIEATDGLIAQVEQVTNLAQSLSEDIYKEDGLADAVVANTEALATLSDDVQGMATLPVQVTAMQTILNGCEANAEEGIEAQDGLIAQVEQVTNLAQSLSEDIYKEDGLADAVVANTEALATLSDDVQGMATIPVQVTAIQNMLTGVEGNEEEGIPAVKGLVDQVQEAANIAENAYMGAEASVKALFGDDETDGLVDKVDIVSSDVQGIQESLRGKATVEEVEALKQTLANVGENITMLGTYVLDEEAEGSVYNQLSTLNDGLKMAQDDLVELAPAVKGNTAAIAKLIEDVDANVNLAQSLSEDLYKEEGLVETVIANQEAIAIVSDDLQGVVESLRGKANVDEVNAEIEDVRANISSLSKFQETFQDEVMAPISDALAEMNDAIEANNTNIQNLSKFQQNFDEEYMSPIDTRFGEIEANVTSLSKFQETFQDDVLVPIQEALDAKVDMSVLEELVEGEGGISKSLVALSDKSEELETSVDELKTALTAVDSKFDQKITDTTLSLQDNIEKYVATLEAEKQELEVQVVQLSTALGQLLNELKKSQALTDEQIENIMNAGPAPLNR